MSQSLSANLVADYQLNDNFSSSVEGAPDLIDLGTTNFFGSATIDGQEVTNFTFAKGTGLRLSTAGLIPNDKYSVVILFEFDELTGYRRILNFKNLTADTGFYSWNSRYDFYNVAGGDGETTYEPDQYIKTVLTRDASGQVTAYLNGKQEFSFNDSKNFAVISSENLLYFFRDNANHEESGGSVARIMLYDDALSATEVASLDPLDPFLGQLHQIKNPSGLVLEVFGGLASDGADVRAGSNQGTDGQKWTITNDGVIKSLLGDFALDLVPTSNSNQQYIVLKPVDANSATQKWEITDTGLLTNKSNGFVAVIIEYAGIHFVDAIAPNIAPYYPGYNQSKWELINV